MAILERIRRIARANIHHVLDKVDTPDLVLKEKIEELQRVIGEAKKALAGFAVAHKRLENEQNQLERSKREQTLKAETALKEDDEPLARKALSEKIKAEGRLNSLRPAIDRSAETYKELKDSLVALNDQLKTARAKLVELRSRQQAASAQKAVAEKLDKAKAVSTADIDFSKFEEDVVHAESEAEIEREIRAEIADVEKGIEKQAAESQVDKELDALKKKLGQS